MSGSLSVVAGNIGGNAVEDPSANATVQLDQGSGGGATTIYAVYIDNSLNTSAASFLKIYDATSGVTVGTTAPEMIFKVAAGATRQFNFPDGIALATGLSYACVTAGGEGGTTAPSSNVPIRIVVT